MQEKMLHAYPDDCLIDEKIKIKVTSLAPHQRVTLRCETVEKDYIYDSFAHFIADFNGDIDLSISPSFGGSYKGVDSMGLFWSMLPAKHQKLGIKYKAENFSIPCKYKIQVYEGFLEDEEFQKAFAVSRHKKKLPLCEKIINRRFCSQNVSRQEIEYGQVRAVLYKPKTPGPFKGVIVIYGGGGGLMDIKAPLLASHGFASLVLPFFRYKDLTDSYVDIKYKYFLEAIEYFTSLPDILPGIGIVGLSWGGHIVMALASMCNKISCVISINGGCLVMPVPKNDFQPFTEEDYVKHYFPVIEGKCKRGGMKSYLRTKDVENIPDKCLLPVEKICGKVMIIFGENDLSYHPRLGGIRFKERMEKFGKGDQVTYLSYPGGGHFIEPPYLPQTLVHYNPAVKVVHASGGEEVENAMACIHAWKEILNFLQNYTGNGYHENSKL